MTNKNLIDTLNETVPAAPETDIELTDTDLDDVAGGVADCTAMCGTFRLMEA